MPWRTYSASGAEKRAMSERSYPVGAVFIAVVSTNPATLLGYGTWSAIAAGRVLVGLDSGDGDFDTAEETGGAKTHTLTSSEMPSHTHTDDLANNSGTGNRAARGQNTSEGQMTTDATGSGGAHNNLQPYFVVYMWKRTA